MSLLKSPEEYEISPSENDGNSRFVIEESKAVLNLFWALVALGALSCILGVGNMLIGTERAERYRNLLEEVRETHRIASRHSGNALGTEEPSLEDASSSNEALLDEIHSSSDSDDSLEKVPSDEVIQTRRASWQLTADQESQIRSLEHRLDYYRFCIVGGKYLLAFGGCLLLAALVVGRIPSSEEREES